MSSSVRRVFLNSYLAYVDDVGESLQDFVAEFDERIIDPTDVNVGHVSLNFCPLFPNIPTYENTIDLSYDGTQDTITIDSSKIYAGVAGTTGNTLIDELNTKFKAVFGGTYEPWSYSSTDARISFTPDTAKSVEFFKATTTADRRIGMTSAQFGITYTPASILTMTNQPILSRTQVIYLTTDLTSDSTSNAQANHGILMMIPIFNAEFGSLVNYSPAYDFGKMSSPRSFTNLRFRILDDLFEPIQFTSNTNLLMSLYVSYADSDEGYKGQLKQPTLGY